MSTRCNIIIHHGASKIMLYRHYDGYLANTGADLAEKFAAANGSADAFLRALMADRYDKASYETEARPVYELTTEVHGDIEYLYKVVFPARGGNSGVDKPEIGYSERHNFEDFDTGWAAGPIMGPLADFTASVNTAIRQANRRLDELKRGDNAKHFASYEPQAELTISQ